MLKANPCRTDRQPGSHVTVCATFMLLLQLLSDMVMVNVAMWLCVGRSACSDVSLIGDMQEGVHMFSWRDVMTQAGGVD